MSMAQAARGGAATTAAVSDAGSIGARLDRLPATRHIWTMVILLSLGGFFEFYDLFMTGYVVPGLVRDHVLTATTPGLFGTTGAASFVAAFFLGLFVGTIVFAFVADRYGRRAVFTISLLWYTAATAVMAFQTTAFGLNLWRFIAGIGIGVELVTIDTYLSELVPKGLRGRAFAINETLLFSAVPVVALVAYLLVPLDPLGFAGWRWLVLIGSAGALLAWWGRRTVPESPRWLAARGRIAEAERVTAAIEARVQAEHGAPLPPPGAPEPVVPRGNLGEIFGSGYLRRTVMLIVFNVFQTVGFYGFSNWVPSLLISQGVGVTRSLLYTFIIAIAAPIGPLLSAAVADRLERKWMIVMAAGGVAVFGLIFAALRAPVALIAFGVLVTLSNNIMSFSFHAYQTELYPTRIRAVAVGFVYSWSRLSAVFSAFVIAWLLGGFGAGAVFLFIAGSMAVVMLTIGALGPRTRDLALEAISH